MKIEIDTKHDSPEEIKKVIKMLNHLVGENSYTNTQNIFEDPNSFGTNNEEPPSSEAPSQSNNAFVNMFGSADEPKEEPMDNTEEPAEEEKEEKIPPVITY